MYVLTQLLGSLSGRQHQLLTYSGDNADTLIGYSTTPGNDCM